MKKLLFLSTLLILIPGCIGKFKRKIIVPTSQGQIQESKIKSNSKQKYNYLSEDEAQNYDEDLDAFVLEDDESGFEDIINNPNKVSSDQDLSFEQEESNGNNLGDPYYNSAAYGLKNIYYDFGRYGIRDDQKSTLEEDVNIIKGLINKGYTVVLAGHACDSKGSSAERNVTISSERPQVIADRLISEGVDSDKIKVVGWGSEMKIVPFGDRIQQAPNRRVECYAYPPGSSNK